MADITMCKDVTCPNAQTCYRFMANVNPFRQSFFIKSPLKEDKTCDEYWKDERHKILRRSK
jgi:hypothetical protein